MSESAIMLRAKVDVAPSGIILRFDSVDADLVELFKRAEEFIVSDVKELSSDHADLTIRSKKIIAFVDPPEPKEDTTVAE